MSQTLLARRTAFVVLGAHRSGTSAMTRVLGLSGARLPDDPHAAGPNNEQGFWESGAVIALDEEILGASDSGWDDVFAGQPRHHLSNFDRVFRQRAAEVLDAAFAGGDPIVLKDPRINVLAAFWDAALRSHDYEPVYVVMVRNPAEVAASMLARNKMPTDQGLLLWLDHMLACERDTRNARRLFVGYDELLENWRGCVDRVEQVWGQALPRRTGAAANAIELYLSPSLRYQRASERALQGGSPVRRMAAEAFAWFQAACGSAESLGGEALDGLRTQLASLREAIEPVLADQRVRLAEYVKHTGALEALREQLQGQFAAERDKGRALLEEVGRLQSAAADQALALASASAREQESTDDLQEIRGQLAEALDQAAERLKDVQADEAREAAFAAIKEDLERHREEIARSREALDLLRAEAKASHEADLARERMIEDLRRTLEQVRSQADASGAEAEIKAMETRYGVLSEELRRVQAAAEDAFLRSRMLTTQLREQARAVEDSAAERAGLSAELETLRGFGAQEAADREEQHQRHISEMDTMRSLHARELDDLRSRQIEDFCEREQKFEDCETSLRAYADDLQRDRQRAEREIETLRAERLQLLGSTSWKLTSLPRRLISGLRRI